MLKVSRDIDILHIGECQNWKEAGRRAHIALEAASALDATIEHRLQSTPEEAARVPFAGSHTALINGIDAFPGGDRTTDLACRVYYTGLIQGFGRDADPIGDIGEFQLTKEVEPGRLVKSRRVFVSFCELL